jgi:ceramide glucosyltransferase
VLDRVSESLFTLGVLTWLVDSRTRYRSRPSPPLLSTLPSSTHGVSILRPLKGVDTNLFENLESSFKQDYPNFEILFSVADENDEALPVVRDLISQYPNVNAKVIIGTLSPMNVWTSRS